jgi:protein-tyrosine phosphatase
MTTTGGDAIVRPAASVLFVCLGNICRSPTAEGVFRRDVTRAGLESRIRMDSAGTGNWQVGKPPDHRAVAAAHRRGYDITALRARQVTLRDFGEFDWILAMDRANLRALKSLRPPEFAGYLGLFLDFAPEMGVKEVPDPYEAGPESFEQMLDLIERASRRLLSAVIEQTERREAKARTPPLHR